VTREEALSTIAAGRVIAILRGDFRETAEEVAETLVEGGIRALEITLTSPGAVEILGRLVRHLGGRAAVGAGTVMVPDDCARARDAGASFAISPHTSREVIAAARRLDMAAFPGAFTPTEIAAALDAGADAVKLFPAEWLGPTGIAPLLGPFPGLRVVPTGGIDVARARFHLASGAWAVGVGSPLVGRGGPTGKRDALLERARAFAAVAAGAAG
jgi:2-dehydro-3-deoxyphosphogluconate aldolase/(4S)-4-hydroxy-2-oxoglutarate aldolase